MHPPLPGSKPCSRTLTVRQLADERGRSPVKVSLRGKQTQQGFSVIEILILTTVLIGVMGACIGFASFSLTTTILYKQTSQATSLAQEAMEATRNFRDAVAWNNNDPGNEYDGLGIMTTSTAYYPQKSVDNPPKWKLIQGTEVAGIFTRSVTFVDGQRNGQNDLVESGGANDPNTKKVTVLVSWTERERSHNVSLISYLTNWK